jgi:sodium-dependent dicarboxylate transporter 2/3/5
MNNSSRSRTTALIAGPLTFLICSFYGFGGQHSWSMGIMAGIAAWVALWWLLEPVHLAITSLLPLVLLPVCGIADMKVVATQYMDQVMFLFIGGFMLAFAIEKHGLHERIALFIICRIGATPKRIMIGVMLTAWLISMWISNTATVMMLLPSVLAIIRQMDLHFSSERQQQRFAAAILLALAYAATIGGMATLVGTPPNMVFYRYYIEHYGSQGMDFMSWFRQAAPLSLVFLLICYLVLHALLLRKELFPAPDMDHFHERKIALGPRTVAEKRVLAVFVATVLLWFTREQWSGYFPNPGWIQDSTVAMAAAILLFFIPSAKNREPLLLWDDVSRLPLHVIFLFGSGFALAYGFESSGLSARLAQQLSFFRDVPLWQLQLIIVLLVLLISEFASNVASIQLLLPVLLAVQKTTGCEPLSIMIPATLAASLGFMLPIATAPNTIVFGAGRMRTAQMMRAGILLNLAGVILIMSLCLLFY